MAQPAFVLQRHDWSESSLIVELFTRGLGRVVTVARGAKKPTSNYRPLLLPFHAAPAQEAKPDAEQALRHTGPEPAVIARSQTRDEVVRREVRQFEGAWYDGAKIKLSRDRGERLCPAAALVLRPRQRLLRTMSAVSATSSRSKATTACGTTTSNSCCWAMARSAS